MKIPGVLLVGLALAGCAGAGMGPNFYTKPGGTDDRRLADYQACRRDTDISGSEVAGALLFYPLQSVAHRNRINPCMEQKGYQSGIYATGADSSTNR